jgi:hypothetical protein
MYFSVGTGQVPVFTDFHWRRRKQKKYIYILWVDFLKFFGSFLCGAVWLLIKRRLVGVVRGWLGFLVLSFVLISVNCCVVD